MHFFGGSIHWIQPSGVWCCARHPQLELCAVNTPSLDNSLTELSTPPPQIASYLKRVLPGGNKRTSLSDNSSGSVSPVMHCAMTSLHYMQWNSFQHSVILSTCRRKTLLAVNLHYVTWHGGLKPGKFCKIWRVVCFLSRILKTTLLRIRNYFNYVGADGKIILKVGF